MEPLIVPSRPSPFKKYIDELAVFCREHNSKFHPITTDRVGRGYYLIKGVSPKAMMIAFVKADPKGDIGWNRISKIDSVDLKDYHGESCVIDGNTIVLDNGKNAKSIKCWAFQVWKKEDVLVIISFDELEKLKEFQGTGDFQVKKTEDDYDLSRFYFTLEGEGLAGKKISIPLETGIDTMKELVKNNS